MGAIVLFTLLNQRREDLSAPATTFAAPNGSLVISSPPPLALPGGQTAYPQSYRRLPAQQRSAVLSPRTRAPAVFGPRPQVRASPQIIYQPAPQVVEDFASEERGSAIYDARTNLPALPTASATPDNLSGDRVEAQRFRNPATTVPKGTIVPAVLETALDSTRPGAVRAIVSRHVRGFDGSRILVPRGSRIYGEYSAELAQGQNRALIRWTRLIRPDGVTIALDSPAADPLGRAGVKGKVNSHFFKRFGGAILQSVLDIGVGAATRKAGGDQVVVALPGSTQQITGQGQQQITPTLTVKHGTSVSVFVAKDLDFTSVER